MHFKGPIPKGLEINHINGIRTDNRPANLEAVTRDENVMHYIREIGVLCGENLPHSKLSRLKVAAIVALSKAKFIPRQIAEVVGVSASTVGSVLAGRSWRHIPR